MKIVILLTLLLSSLYASKSCYTVQLMSAYNSTNIKDEILNTSYDSSCKVMEIGKNITVRCGCFEKIKDAREHLSLFSGAYKKAYIATTYAYRFEDKKSAVIVAPLLAPKPIVVVKEEKKKLQVVSKKKPALVLEKKSKKTIKSKEVKTKTKKKKSKKPKEKKIKYVKKRDSVWFYDRYLDLLESRHPNRYGYKYKFGAQVSYDMGYVNEARENYTDSDFRRIRVYHKGSFMDERLFYELEYSFTGPNNYKDILVGYKDRVNSIGLDYRVKAGNIKIPFSLETYTSSKNITFMERAASDAFAENRKLGVELLLSQKLGNSRVNLFSALYSDSIDERKEDAYGQDGVALRLTYSYKFHKRHLISLGAAYMSRDMQGKNVKLNQSSGSRLLQHKYLSVKIKNVETMAKNNVEALYIFNKYSLQGEYTRFGLDAYNKRDYLQNYNFDAYYIEGSYFLIGKGKKYKFKESILGKIKPNIDGALELALRYSYINLTDTSNDKDEVGGTQSDYTMGVNWYVSKELKFMLNYIISEPTGTEKYDGLLQIVQGRVLFAF